jgi:cell wall-associated NlpC family hydrolase
MVKLMRRCVFLRATLILAVSAAAAGCASTGATGTPVPRPFPVPRSARIEPPAVEAAAPQPTIVDGYALVGTALSLRGTPYRNGGADPAGFDCSGFTQYVFAKHGVALPREVRDQFGLGNPVKDGELAAGDLLFFTTVAPGATHVAIAIGGDQFVHAPSSTGVVRVERLSTSYWSTRYLGARRVE